MKVRKHPDLSWPRPNRFQELDTNGFKPLRSVPFDGRVGQDWVFGTGKARVRIRPCTDGILRITVAPDGQFPPDRLSDKQAAGLGILRHEWPAVDVKTKRKAGGLELRTGRLRVAVTESPFSMKVLDADGKVLLETDAAAFSSRPAANGYETLSRFKMTPEDHIFGFGGRTHRVERTGSTADLYAIKVETLRGDYGGFPLPYFLNTRGYGFVLDNPWPHVYFDMGRTSPDQWLLHTPGGYLDFYVLAGPSFAEITRGYCELTGLPALPPKWMLGFWVSWADQQINAGQTLEIAERLRREGWPLDVLVLDMHWRSGGNIDWGLQKFGEGRPLIEFLKAHQAHLCLHLNNTMFTGATLEEGKANGALRIPEHNVIVPNLPDEQAANWYWNTHAPRVEEGADAWWTDNGERVEGTLSCGLPSRNLYGQLWNELLFDRMNAMGRENRLVLSRGGWLGAQRCTLTWPGDTGPGVDRLKEDLLWHLNCSVSGIPYNTVDLGGFFGSHDDTQPLPAQADLPADHRAPAAYARTMNSRDNIIRRVINSFLLFTAPRVHGPVKLPWMYSKELQELWRFYLELWYRFLPYHYSLVVHCAETGEPPHRPLVWHHPQDPNARTVADQLYWGRDLLLCPVVEEGAEEREVYLPEGEWIDFWTGEAHAGQRRVIVDAPMLGKNGLPIFVRRGAMIPMQRPAQSVAEQATADWTLHIWPAQHGQTEVRLDAESCCVASYRVSGKKMTVRFENAPDVKRRVEIVVHTSSDKAAFALDATPDAVLDIEPGEAKQVTVRM